MGLGLDFPASNTGGTGKTIAAPKAPMRQFEKGPLGHTKRNKRMTGLINKEKVLKAYNSNYFIDRAPAANFWIELLLYFIAVTILSLGPFTILGEANSNLTSQFIELPIWFHLIWVLLVFAGTKVLKSRHDNYQLFFEDNPKVMRRLLNDAELTANSKMLKAVELERLIDQYNASLKNTQLD